MSGYFKRLFVALDIMLNTLIGGRNETVSSRCGWQLTSADRPPCRFCLGLCAWIDRAFNGRWKGHCINNRMDPL